MHHVQYITAFSVLTATTAISFIIDSLTDITTIIMSIIVTLIRTTTSAASSVYDGILPWAVALRKKSLHGMPEILKGMSCRIIS